MPWQALNLSLPEELSTIGSGISSGLSAVKSALQAAKQQIQAMQALAAVSDDPTTAAYNAAIQAVVTAALELIDEILDSAGIYILIVPLPKKGIVVLASGNSPDEPGTNSVEAPIGNILAQLPAADAAQMRGSSLFEQAFNPASTFTGGNAYFIKTLTESLHDAGDEERPRFQRSDTWAWTVAIAGASDVTSIASLATFLDKLLGQNQHADAVGSSRGVTSIVPVGVRVAPSGRGQVAVVEWDPVPPSKLLESYGGARLVPTRFAVIRSTDFRARTAFKVGDLFTGELTDGATGQFGATCVHLHDYDGITSRWIDDGVEPDINYFYHVAFATRLEPGTADPSRSTTPGEEEPQTQDMGFEKLSACMPFKLPSATDKGMQRTMSKPPDWIRTPSVAQMFPPVNKFIDKIKEQIKTMAKSSQTAAKKDEAYLAFLDRELVRYTKQINEITNYIGQIQSILDAPHNGLYSNLGSGTGNVSAFLSDVMKAFNDTSDENSPPFTHGDEYVTGVVLLAVGPDAAKVQKAFAALQSLFAPPTDDQATNPVGAGVASVRTALAEIEQHLIDAIANPNAPGTPSGAFNEDLTPAAPGTGDSDCVP